MISEILIAGALIWLVILVVRYWRIRNGREISKIRRDKSLLATVFAFVIAPVVPAVAFGIWSVADSGGVTLLWTFLGFIGFAGICYEVAVVATAVFAVPIFLLLNWMELIRWWTSSISGCLIGLLVGIALSGIPHGLTGLEIPVFCGGSGIVAGVVFWLIWRIGQKLPPVPTLANQTETKCTS